MLKLSKRAIKKLIISILMRNDHKGRGGDYLPYRGLGPELWGCKISKKDTLCWGDIDLCDLASAYGTPLHVVSRYRLEENYQKFKRAFSRKNISIELATSYKTNPLPSVLGALHEAGTYAETISHFELWLALRLGLSPKRIILNGPGKTSESLELAVQKAIKLINIDGLWEIPLLAGLAEKHGTKQEVGVRVVTSVGWASQFGLRIDNNEAFAAFENINRFPQLHPTGLHFHLGTGIKNPNIYRQAVKEVLQFSTKLREKLGIKITCLDLGGGFGIPTIRSMDEWDGRIMAEGLPSRLALPDTRDYLKDYANFVMDLIENYVHNSSDNDLEVVFEPGRAVTGNAQILLLSVVGVKERFSGKRDVILNGGKNISMPLAWETHQIFPANKMNDPHSVKHDLFGPLCHPGDVIARNLPFPKVDSGDVIAIMDSGAYFIPNQMNFSYPRTAVVMIENNGDIRVIRQQEQFEDIIRHDIF